MTTLVFIHGTGVRQKSFDATLSAITGQVKAEMPGVAVKPCFWGERFGVRFRLGGTSKSIPDYDTTRGVGDPEPVEKAAAAWAKLLEDPYYELRLLVELGGEAPPLPGNQATPGEELFAEVKKLYAETSGLRLPTPEWQTAYRVTLEGLVDDPEFKEILEALIVRDEETELALARAIVAATMTHGAAEQLPALDGSNRDALLIAILDEIVVGRRAGVLSRLAKPALGFATRWASRRRGRISDAILEEPGDILLYQARGDPLREFIKDTITKCSGDVFVLAHSLGGIMAVDLLAKEQVPSVKGLITVGSQAPFLYETGALVSLAPDDRLNAHFPPWLNVYDRSDLLSYLAAGVFPDTKTIIDFEAISRQPALQAHSAYFTNDAVWRRIAHFVETLT